MRKVFHVRYNSALALFPDEFTHTVVSSLKDFDPSHGDILCLYGGSDIPPQFYGELFAQGAAYVNPIDELECAVLLMAVQKGIPSFGICKGYQWQNVINGGRMFSHVTGHENGDHPVIDTETSEVFYTNSSHHQFIRPMDTNIDVLLVATSPTPTVIEVNSNAPSVGAEEFRQIEAAWYPNILGFGVEFHPEWGTSSDRAVSWTKEKIVKYLVNQ